MVSHINTTGFVLCLNLSIWRDECNIPKAKRIQKVVDALQIRQQEFKDKYGLGVYNEPYKH
jgi:hypothetical protein